MYMYYIFLHSIHRLVWHDNTIPEEEIWVKVGGDMGGGTFKLCVFNIQGPRHIHQSLDCTGPLQGTDTKS